MSESRLQSTDRVLEEVLQGTEEPGSVADGVGLCLSGGGYRAMVFHLGALTRLNETGWLHRVARVSSVSGGSIIAGVLGLAWKRLSFEEVDGRTVATDFDRLVGEPVREMARRDLDVRSVLGGFLVPGRISRRVAAAYDEHLFHGATLADLPADEEGPRFIFTATNLGNGALVRFSRPYVRDSRDFHIPDPRVPVADCVAASSAFPPVLSPFVLRVPGHPELRLTDGGVYDNLGLEPVLKNFRTVLVSDGGGTFGVEDAPPKDFLRGLLRVLNVVDVQVRRLRRREVMGALRSGARRGGFWAVNSPVANLEAPASTLRVSPQRAEELAHTPTRLKEMDDRTLHGLVNWGYAVTDAVLRAYVEPGLPEPAGFPFPGERMD